MADNQQKWIAFWSVIKRPSLASLVDNFQTFQTNAREQKVAENYANGANQMNELRVAWMNTQDHWIAKTCDRAIKLKQVADWIRDYYWDKYDFSDDYWTDVNVVDAYKKNNPASEAYIKAYVTNDDDTDCDPTNLYKTMWWWKDDEKEEEEDTRWFFEKLWSNLWWSFRKMWQWLRTIANAANQNPEVWAIRDYAYEKYWRLFSKVTEDEWEEIAKDIQKDPTILNKYMNENEGIKDIIMWWTVSLMNVNPRWLLTNLWFSALWATPYVEDALWLVWEWASKVWEYANKLPWLKQYRDSLENDETKKERDQYVWQEIIWLLTRFLLRWKQWEVKSWVDDFYKEVKNWQWSIIENFNEALEKRNRLQAEKKLAAEKINQQKRQVASQKVMEDLAWTLLEPKERTMKSDLANWLANLPDRVLNETKTFDWLTKEINDTQWGIVELQNAILSNMKKKTWPETDVYKTKNWATIHPVKDAINLLKKLYSWQPDALAKLKKYENKYKKWEITELDKKNLAREISVNWNSFDDNFHLKNRTSPKSIESVREWLQNNIKSSHPFIDSFMTTTDSVYSNLAKVKTLANEKANKVSSTRDKQKLPSTTRNLLKPAINVVDTIISKWKNIYDNIESSVREPYKPTTLEKDLPAILKAFAEEKQNIPWNKWWFNISAFIEWLDKRNYDASKYKYTNDVNNFLEDIIEATDVEKTQSLWWQSYPSLQEILYELWATEADVWAIEQAFNIEQPSLFPGWTTKKIK